MKTVNVDVYKFDELSKDVQKKVINHYRDLWGNKFGDELDDYINTEFSNYVDDLNLTLSYSLNSCQGDGVSFTGTVEGKEELLKLANFAYNGNIPREILRLINWGIIYKVNFDRIGSHYVHKYTTDIEVVDNYNMDNIDYCHITEAMLEFEKFIKGWYLDVCDRLEKFGYNMIDCLTSDDNIEEDILANDLEFFADGSDFNDY